MFVLANLSCSDHPLSHGNEDFVFRVRVWHIGPAPQGRVALPVALAPPTLSRLASTSGRGAILSSQRLPRSPSVSVTCPGTGLFSMDISVSSFSFQNCPTVSHLAHVSTFSWRSRNRELELWERGVGACKQKGGLPTVPTGLPFPLPSSAPLKVEGKQIGQVRRDAGEVPLSPKQWPWCTEADALTRECCSPQEHP